MKTAWIGLGAFLILGTLWNGLYYELPMFAMDAFLSVTVLFLWVRKREITFYAGNVFAAVLVILYIASIFFAVDKEQAVIEAGRIYSIEPVSFLAAALEKEDVNKLLQLLVWLGAVLVVWGYAFGFVRNGRLESTLQYANSLAMFLLISSLAGFWLGVQLKKRILFLPTVISLFGLVMTSSRFVWLLAPAAVIGSYGLNPQLKRLRTALWTIVVVIFVGISGGILAGPLLSSRLSSIRWGAGELQLRMVYWKDAFRLFTHHLVLGTGGGGWALLGPHGYYVKYVHNEYLQIADDVGIIGVAAIVGWIGYYLFQQYGYLRKSSKERDPVRVLCLILTVSMAVHAGFDIDLTYPLMMGILIFLIMVSGVEETPLLVWEAKSGYRLFAAVSVILMGTVVAIWLSIGFGMKEQATRIPLPEDSIRLYRKAANWMPWDHTIPMKEAHLYIEMYNRTHKPLVLQQAKEAMSSALKNNPYDPNYRMEMEKISRIVTNEILPNGH